MKKTIIILGALFLFIMSNAQIGRYPFSASLAPEGCGTGTSNYGDYTATSSYSEYTGNYVIYVPVTVELCGKGITAVAYVGPTASTHVKFALYTDNAGKPGTLIAGSESAEISETANAWNTYTFTTSPSVTSATTYWVASISDVTHNIGSTGGTLQKYREVRTYANGFPATANAFSISTTANTNVYITVNHEL